MENSDIPGLNFKKLLGYYLMVGLTVLASFLPFLSSEFISNFSASIALWFQKFEFNASIYYIIRWIGFQVKGYNIIETVGKILPLMTILVILGLTFFRKYQNTKQLLTNMLFAVTAYLFLSTTVHPWYLLWALSFVATHFRSTIWVYSLTISWSYAVLGSLPSYHLPIWVGVIEYLPVYGLLGWELIDWYKHRCNR